MPIAADRTLTGALIIEPMEARLVDALPNEPGWQFEPKWDGFRCIAIDRATPSTCAPSRASRSDAIFRKWWRHSASLPGDDFVLDGELVIPQGGKFSFDALQMRLHPAESRIRKLAETPASSSCSTCCATAGQGT